MNDVIIRLQTMYASLRKSEKKIADYLQQHSQEPLDISITEFAKRLNLSETTISRFCRTLGCRNYQDFKLALAVSQNAVNGFRNIPTDIHENDSIPEIGGKLSNALSRALAETQRGLNVSAVDDAVEALIHARQVLLYAIAGSTGIAHASHHLFTKAGINCAVYTDGYMQAVTASMVDEESVAFGVSSTGMSKHVIDAVKIASDNGASTIALTSNRESELAHVSQICLFIASGNENTPLYGDFMEAKVCQLYIMELLYLSILFKQGNISKERLKKSTEVLETYYSPPGK